MEALQNLKDNKYEGANAEALKELDADTIENRLIELNDRIENVEYLIYNSEEWIDNVVAILTVKAEEALIKELELVVKTDTFRITDIMDDLAKDLKKQLADQAMRELYEVE